MPSVLICPVCGALLYRNEKTYTCDKGHSFDIARAGYVNLLPPQKASCHGDNKEMIRARRDFLDSGTYGFLADAVADTVKEYIDGIDLLDAGCGECYYTEKILQKNPRLSVTGMDISKDALIFAARRMPHITLVAASLYSMPVADLSVDMAVLMFAPFAESELTRILKEKGKLLMVIPGRKHLFGLKSLIYDTPYENEVADFTLPGFTLLSHKHLEKTVTFGDKAVIESLFKMTPYYYRTRKGDAERLLTAEKVETPLSFEVLVYEKNRIQKTEATR